MTSRWLAATLIGWTLAAGAAAGCTGDNPSAQPSTTPDAGPDAALDASPPKPEAPPVSTQLATVAFKRDVAATFPAGDRVIAAYADKDVVVFDLSDARAPKEGAVIPTTAKVVGVDFDEERGLAFVVDVRGGVYVIAVRTADGAELLRSSPGTLTGATGMARVGDRVYVLAGDTLAPYAVAMDADGVATGITVEAQVKLGRAAAFVAQGGGAIYVGYANGDVEAWVVAASGVPARVGIFAVGGELRALVAKGSFATALVKGVGLVVVDFGTFNKPVRAALSDAVADVVTARLFGRTLLVALERGAYVTIDLTDFARPVVVTNDPGAIPAFLSVVNGNVVTGSARQGRVGGVPPVVAGLPPQAARDAFPLNGLLPVTFSKPIDPAAAAAAGAVRLTCNGQPVTGGVVVSADGLTVSFRPAATLPQGATCALDVSGVKDLAGLPVRASANGVAIEFKTATAPPAPVTNPGSKYKHTPDGTFTDFTEGAASHEWFDVKPARGMYTYFYADFDGSALHLLNDWYVNPERIDPDCYNQFAAWTGGGVERWDIRAYGNGRVEVRKNGQLLDTKASGVEGGAGFGVSPMVKSPHTIYELKIPAAAGAWGVQLHDPGPSFQCNRRLGDTSAMSGSLTGGQGGSSSTVNAGGGLATPAVPTLEAPADNAPNLDLPLTLRWGADNPADRFVTYVVLLGGDAALTRPVWTATTTGTSYTLPRGLLGSGVRYFWRVLAVNNLGRATSEPRSFTTIVKPAEGSQRLVLTKSGQGTVASAPAGIDCGPACSGSSALFTTGTSVTLTATPAQGQSFVGWQGGCAATQGNPAATTLVMDRERACTAVFTAASSTFQLTTNLSPPAGGTVLINNQTTCNQASCVNAFPAGSTVSLVAQAAGTHTFSGWSGNCQDDNPSTSVVMSANRTCTATFTPRSYTLTVAVQPTGAATVSATSPVGQITSCGAQQGTCTGTYNAGTNVALAATVANGFAFQSWSGDCAGSGTSTNVSMTGTGAAKTCTANLVPLVALTALKAGTGTGTVTSSPGGLNCGTACDTQTVQVTQNSSVTLSASPALGSIFTGWSGCSTSTNASIQIQVGQATTCTATFAAQSYALTVVPSPTTGGGVVASTNVAGISACGAGTQDDCSETYPAQQIVNLSATASQGYRFGGWSGAGCGSSVSMTANRTCTASFVQQVTLQVGTNGGNGTGTVSGSGISCSGGSGTCSRTVDAGTQVTLAATPSVGSVFTGWEGCSSSTQPQITIAVDQATTCVAAFALQNYGLTVAVSPSGGGSVSSNPSGMTCGAASCSGTYGAQQQVSLFASPNNGFRFGAWTGDCTNTTSTTSGVTMTAARSCTATFVPDAPLTVNKTGSTGTGTVTSSPAGISCGTGCGNQTVGFAPGTQVTLTAAASNGSAFGGWAGCSTATTASITVTVSQATTCTAKFDLLPVTLAFTISPANSGSLFSIAPSSPRIQCPAGGLGGCSASFTPGTQVQVAASPNSGYTQVQWGGDCAGAQGLTPTFTMNANRTCTVTFVP